MISAVITNRPRRQLSAARVDRKLATARQSNPLLIGTAQQTHSTTQTPSGGLGTDRLQVRKSDGLVVRRIGHA